MENTFNEFVWALSRHRILIYVIRSVEKVQLL